VLGGFLEPGETPEQGLARELVEETGLECSIGRYIGGFVDSYGDDGDATLNLAYECQIGAGDPQAADDVAELRWFAPDALPPGSEFAFQNSIAILDAWLASRPG
jgi:ADP-ribose pyrophosphatase YjhB (NUDIX family)